MGWAVTQNYLQAPLSRHSELAKAFAYALNQWLKPHPWLFKSLASVQGPRYLSLEEANQIPSGSVILK